jgi:hypothetical protein
MDPSKELARRKNLPHLVGSFNLPKPSRKQSGTMKLGDVTSMLDHLSSSGSSTLTRNALQERVITKSKEGKRALAAAAGVEINLDSPVIEKTQPQATHSPSPPVREGFRPTRKYTAVLQARPSL